MNARFGWVLPAFVLAAVGAAVGWQHARQQHLRRDLLAARQEIYQTALVRQENDRLRAEAARNADTAGDTESLRAELARLEREKERQQTAAASANADRFGPGVKIPAAEWKNAGNGTARAALETMLWAAAGGDIDAFARGIFILPGPTHQQAEAFLKSLPPAEQARYGTPERLIAALTIPDVPLGSFEARDWSQGDWAPVFGAMEAVNGIVADPAGKLRAVHLIFGRSDQGWKLVVTPGVIAKYASQLKPTAATP